MQERARDVAAARVHRDLHVTDFLVHLVHGDASIAQARERRGGADGYTAIDLRQPTLPTRRREEEARYEGRGTRRGGGGPRRQA